jgi:hypothetical protein
LRVKSKFMVQLIRKVGMLFYPAQDPEFILEGLTRKSCAKKDQMLVWIGLETP